MLNIRTIILSIMLVFVLIFVVGKAVAATTAIPSTDVADRSLTDQTKLAECASLPSRLSLHNVYMDATNVRVSYTEDGPTGVDGGLMHLLSAYRTCS